MFLLTLAIQQDETRHSPQNLKPEISDGKYENRVQTRHVLRYQVWKSGFCR
jgi:hypothetical protein